MERRKFEKLNLETSLLGFGCMRFPTLENGTINVEETSKMIDVAMKAGVTYIDTAYPYHNGQSEPVVGKILDNYDRNSYVLATKCPIWEINTLDDAKRIFASQLERLNKDYVDFYLLHALDQSKWDTVKKLDLIAYFERMKAEGKIKYLGFSFHDEYEVFEDIINAHKWDFCQIQLNYMDTCIQAGMKGYELATKLEIPLVIMEPIKGGSLANFAGDINSILKNERPHDSIASWALRYLGSLPNVKVILSGMSNMEQVEDNIATCANFVPFTEEDYKTIEKVEKALNDRIQNGCTGCNYCMPCPAGVNIPLNFKIWNQYHIYNNVNETNYQLSEVLGESAFAKHCVECGKCEQSCPQKISIREDLKRAQEDFDQVKK